VNVREIVFLVIFHDVLLLIKFFINSCIGFFSIENYHNIKLNQSKKLTVMKNKKKRACTNNKKIKAKKENK